MKTLAFVMAGLLLVLLFIIVMKTPEPIPAGSYDFVLNPEKDPAQRETSEKEFPIRISHGTMMLTPLAEYDITAAVLSKKRYYFGWSAEMAPFDYALGWGTLAVKEARATVRFSQSGRWYYYRLREESPFSPGYVALHSSNHHIIPATPNLRYLLKRLKKGELIRLTGYLVYAHGFVKGKEVFWRSSLSRKDTGDGACEVFYVHTAYYRGSVYE
ncbi:MAG TPA: hypothetical protein ENL15_02515 [Firmicutes bacterium]|nr:hypothetical protein [Bacillota bacterium]